MRPRAEQIRKVVNGRSQEPNHGLEGRLVGSAGVAAAGDEHLGAAEALGKLLALLAGDSVLKFREVLALFFLDVLRERAHEGLERWLEVGVGRFHVLELLELFFDLSFVSIVSLGLERK